MSQRFFAALAWVALLWVQLAARAQADPLIVVEDRGGVSALPYYDALSLQSRTSASPPVAQPTPRKPFSEADMLPVHSTRLSPGRVQSRTIAAPGLTPLFLIGGDERSRAWLRQRLSRLRERHAVGFVVNIDSAQALSQLRTLAPGLILAPVSGDDIAQRLRLRHYPVLITATGIMQ